MVVLYSRTAKLQNHIGLQTIKTTEESNTQYDLEKEKYIILLLTTKNNCEIYIELVYFSISQTYII